MKRKTSRRLVKTIDPRSALDEDDARRLQEEILERVRGYGLDPYRTVFEMLDFDAMNEVVAYGGFPNRYPHWRFGMEFETLRKSYAYGLHKIYELVINNDPCYAYLLRSNTAIEQKVVMAHVYGHSDFFKNNLWFAPTNRKMLDRMANHGARVRKLMERHGVDRVENFLDTALSVETLIDYHSMYTPPPRPSSRSPESPDQIPRFVSHREYMDRFLNPPDYIAEQRKKIQTRRLLKRRFPERPVYDVLGFLCRHAPLEEWEREILSIIRDEAYYFAPQAVTKIMNEGWATYWHSKILTEGGLRPPELIDYADLHAGVLAGGGALNPYKLGLELFRDIASRGEAEGNRTLFEVRRVHNDITFLDNFLHEDFVRRHKLYLYRLNPQRGTYEIASRDFTQIKKTLLFKLTNMGNPRLRVEDGNFRGQGGLLLKHDHEGVDLDMEEARDAMRAVERIWRKPVHLWTAVEGQHRLVSWDGKEIKETHITEKGP